MHLLSHVIRTEMLLVASRHTDSHFIGKNNLVPEVTFQLQSTTGPSESASVWLQVTGSGYNSPLLIRSSSNPGTTPNREVKGKNKLNTETHLFVWEHTRLFLSDSRVNASKAKDSLKAPICQTNSVQSEAISIMVPDTSNKINSLKTCIQWVCEGQRWRLF